MSIRSALPLLAVLGLPIACDDDDEPPRAEEAGQPCAVEADCYAELARRDELAGTVECLADRVPGGYCTHTCAVDADCCAIPGECRTGIAQVCSPLESETDTFCLLSCEPEDLEAAAAEGGYAAPDGNAYCTHYAGPAFGCRSSGGGSDNRMVCMP